MRKRLAILLGLLFLMSVIVFAGLTSAENPLPVDAYISFEADTIAGAVTLANSATVGGTWGVGSSGDYLKISTDPKGLHSLRGPVSVNGKVYDGISTRAISMNDNDQMKYISFSGGRRSVFTYGGFITIGVNKGTTSYAMLDAFYIIDSPWICSPQILVDSGCKSALSGTTFDTCVNAEAKFGTTKHSAYILLNSGKTYWFTTKIDQNAGMVYLRVYDPDNGYALMSPGEVNIATDARSEPISLKMGRGDRHGNNAGGTTSYIDEVIFDWTNAVYPLIPGSATTGGTTCSNDCSPSGSRQCYGTSSYQTCGNYDSDSCLEWGSTVSCASDQTCSNGACVSTGGTQPIGTPNFVRVAGIISPNDAPVVIDGKTYDPMRGQGVVTISGVQAGNFLVVISSLSATQTTTVTSNTGENWIYDVHSTYPQNPGDSLDIFHASDVSGGSKTIIITSPQTTRSLRALVLEYSGVAPTSQALTSSAHGLDGSTYKQSVDTTGNAGSVTTTIPNSLIVVACRTDSDFLHWSPGTGYTMRDNPNSGGEPDQKVGVEDMIATVPGTYSGKFTFYSDLWTCGMVAYAPSGSSDGGQLACTNDCSLSGSKQCSGNGVVTCGNYDGDSCLEWGGAVACASGTVCSGGVCVASQTCSGTCKPGSCSTYSSCAASAGTCTSGYCCAGSCTAVIQVCSDGTAYNACSGTKPMYCSAGTLISRCSSCGCPAGQTCSAAGTCTSNGVSWNCGITPGDVNNDGKVDIVDLVFVATRFT